MAMIFGTPGEEFGDKLVYESLKTLPEGWIIYAQPVIPSPEGPRYPDYIVVHPEVGVIVLEVKDWREITEITPTQAKVYRGKVQREEWEHSPIEQARTASFAVSNRLRNHQELVNYSGKLDFPYRFAAILPHFSTSMLTRIRKVWSENQVFGSDDIQKERIEQTLRQIPAPFPGQMSRRQVDVVRAVIDPHLVLVNAATGAFKGVLDTTQEALAKEPMKEAAVETQAAAAQMELLPPAPSVSARLSHLDQEVPEEVASVKSSTGVRLLRGFAGTGKTDVLILRAHYLHQTYPEADILVTTFNRPLFEERLTPELKCLAPRVELRTFTEICAEAYNKKYGGSVRFQITEGVINHLVNDEPAWAQKIEEFGVPFICTEIEWMKEMGLTTREKYLETLREGRGGADGRSLSRAMKERVFDIFTAYQEQLDDMRAPDWSDLYHRAWKYLRSGQVQCKKYDAVLVDEAQHFAPSWVGVLNCLLKPNGSLFLCDDPSQSVYRAYSWRQKGVEVAGRTRWLRTPYRCTRQIFEAAYALIENNPRAKGMLSEGGYQITPDLAGGHMRDGRLPEVHQFPSWADEDRFMHDRIRGLIYEGLYPNEIAILHSKKFVLEKFGELKAEGVVVDELRRRTGMEYKAVFLPRVNDIFDRDASMTAAEDDARQQLIFYMAMTRARDQVFILMENKWPTLLKPIREKVTWVKHDEKVG